MSNEQKSQIHKLTEHSGWAGNHFAEKRNGTLPERRQGEMGVSSQYKWFLPPPQKNSFQGLKNGLDFRLNTHLTNVCFREFS